MLRTSWTRSAARWAAVLAGALSLLAARPARAQFDPSSHGFSFQNYSNEMSPVNLTSAEVYRMFGDAVCARGGGSECTLTPNAQQWMEQTSQSMSGGHCEGMAVLSLRFFHGQADPSMFDTLGAMSANDLGIDGNESLQREIGYWFATQAVPPVSMAERRLAPSMIVEQLRTSFEGGGEVYTLGFYKRDMTGGHAVTPFDVVENEAGETAILVYDNNFPNEARSIVVDVEAETWRYVAAASPDVPASEYEGDASTATLGITPMSAREGTLQCPFCGSYESGMSAPRTLSVTGDARLLIEDESGDRVGHTEDGDLVNEIGGTQVVAQRSDDLWQDRAEPSYVLPGGSELEVTIADGGGGGDEVADFGVSGRGYYLGIENIVLDADQVDIAYIGQDTASIGYRTRSMETPDIVLAVETEAADWVIYVRSRGDSAGQSIDASIDFESGGVLDVIFSGEDESSEFDLYLTRIDDTSDIEFGHEMVQVPNGSFVSVFFGEFDADGEALVMEIDRDGDDVVDETINLADDGGAPPTTTPPPAGSGCSVGPARSASDVSWAMGLLFAATLGWRRRRARG